VKTLPNRGLWPSEVPCPVYALHTILSSVVPVFAILGLGWVYGRFRDLPAREMSDLVMWILIPCLVVSAVGTRPMQLVELGRIGAAAALVVLGCGLVTWLLFRGRPDVRAAMLSAMFMNSANLGFPLALLAFGQEGLARQVIFYVAINLLHSTVGIALARGRGGLREALRLPLLYSGLLGLLLATTGTLLPEVVARPLDLVGKATLPLMLLMLGVRLRRSRLLHLGPALVISLVRLGVGLGLGLAAVELLGLTGFARGAVLLGAGMPVAVFNTVLAERYELHPELVASSVVLSTLLGLATIPLVLALV
jgi:malate permease and related proteins